MAPLGPVCSYLHAPDKGAVEKVRPHCPDVPQVPDIPDVDTVVLVDAGQPAVAGVVGQGDCVGVGQVCPPAGRGSQVASRGRRVLGGPTPPEPSKCSARGRFWFANETVTVPRQATPKVKGKTKRWDPPASLTPPPPPSLPSFGAGNKSNLSQLRPPLR